MNQTLLEVKNVSVEFPTPNGVIRAVDDVSFNVAHGETMAVVGESGCGKTTLARAILGLQPMVSGEINLLDGKDDGATVLSERVGMVWQDPFASLDPRWKISRIIEEPLKVAKKAGDVSEILKNVGLRPEMADRYPHQLSGGQRQRVAIGRALALRPKLIICDEPTAALDLSIQAQILNLLRDLQTEIGCSYVYISHDLATVRFVADKMTVMYFGKVVEQGSAEQIFVNPQDKYTKRLLESVLTIDNIGHLPDVVEDEETARAIEAAQAEA